MDDDRESDLNLLHQQQISSIDLQSVAEIFMRKDPRKMFKKSVLLEDQLLLKAEEKTFSKY